MAYVRMFFNLFLILFYFIFLNGTSYKKCIIQSLPIDETKEVNLNVRLLNNSTIYIKQVKDNHSHMFNLGKIQ